MKVILMDDVRETGRRGEEVDVAPGFARNYLFPRGKAVEATEANRKVFEQRRDKLEERLAEEQEQAERLAERFEKTRVEIVKRVGESQTLYGSVSASEIAEKLEEQGIEIDRRKIDIGEGIKTIGDHKVDVHLHPEVVVELIVTVLPYEEE